VDDVGQRAGAGALLIERAERGEDRFAVGGGNAGALEKRLGQARRGGLFGRVVRVIAANFPASWKRAVIAARSGSRRSSSASLKAREATWTVCSQRKLPSDSGAFPAKAFSESSIRPWTRATSPGYLLRMIRKALSGRAGFWAVFITPRLYQKRGRPRRIDTAERPAL